MHKENFFRNVHKICLFIVLIGVSFAVTFLLGNYHTAEAAFNPSSGLLTINSNNELKPSGVIGIISELERLDEITFSLNNDGSTLTAVKTTIDPGEYSQNVDEKDVFTAPTDTDYKIDHWALQLIESGVTGCKDYFTTSTPEYKIRREIYDPEWKYARANRIFTCYADKIEVVQSDLGYSDKNEGYIYMYDKYVDEGIPPGSVEPIDAPVSKLSCSVQLESTANNTFLIKFINSNLNCQHSTCSFEYTPSNSAKIEGFKIWRNTDQVSLNDEPLADLKVGVSDSVSLNSEQPMKIEAYGSIDEGASLKGFVKDTLNNPVSNAKITLSTNENGKFEAVSESDGSFLIEKVNRGCEWEINVIADGYDPYNKILSKEETAEDIVTIDVTLNKTNNVNDETLKEANKAITQTGDNTVPVVVLFIVFAAAFCVLARRKYSM